MVSRTDIHDIQTELRGAGGEDGLIDALSQLEELTELSDQTGVSVNDDAYAEAQETFKTRLVKLWAVADDMVDRTDELELEDGTTVLLPNGPTSRDSDGTPQLPGNS